MMLKHKDTKNQKYLNPKYTTSDSPKKFHPYTSTSPKSINDIESLNKATSHLPKFYFLTLYCKVIFVTKIYITKKHHQIKSNCSSSSNCWLFTKSTS